MNNVIILFGYTFIFILYNAIENLFFLFYFIFYGVVQNTYCNVKRYLYLERQCVLVIKAYPNAKRLVRTMHAYEQYWKHRARSYFIHKHGGNST